MADRTIVVTGASGFLGTATTQYFASRGWLVRAVGRHPPLVSQLPFVRVDDYQSMESLARAVRGADAVIHLAARVHVMRENTRDPLGAFRRDNVQTTAALVEASRREGVSQFVLASSVKAVGETTDVPWTEDTPPAPADPYGISKLEAEHIAASARSSRFHVAVLRFPLIYGPGIRANARRLFDVVWRGWPIPLGAVHNRRSLLYVGNAVVAMDAVLSTPAGSDTFFVSDDHDVSTPDLIRTIAEALGVRARLISVPVGVFRLAVRTGDFLSRVVGTRPVSPILERVTGSLTVDISKLKRSTRYRPLHTFTDGIRETAAWYRSTIVSAR